MKIRIALLLACSCATSFGASIQTFQAADVVLGQTDFVSKLAPVTPSAASMDGPTSVAVDPTTGKVFVADTANNRVLRFSTTAAFTSGSNAEAVLGQPDFTSNGAADTQKEMFSPIGLAIDNSGTLWVADSGNHRVLRFDQASSKPMYAVNADGVLGQANFSSNANPSPPTQASMNTPRGVAVDANGTLWVADSVNNRVLRFSDAADSINGANADGVLGQPTFDIFLGGTMMAPLTTQYTMEQPTGLAVDSSGHLWVADTFNRRVLRFDDADNANNGALASAVLGQPDFVTLAPATATTAAAFGPLGVAVDATGALWVTDLSNRRAIRFNNAAGKGNGAAADAVLGQIDLVSKVTAPPTITPTANNLSGSFGLAIDATGALWIADTSNNRVLHYTPRAAAPAAVSLALHGKKKVVTTATRLTVKGTASCPDGVAHVEYRVGKKGGFKTAGGTTGWSFKAALKPGKNTITIHAFGATGAEATATLLVIRG